MSILKRNFVTCIYLKGQYFAKLKDNEKIIAYDSLLKRFLETKKENNKYIEILEKNNKYIEYLKIENHILNIENKY
jgi:hypothetical protein